MRIITPATLASLIMIGMLSSMGRAASTSDIVLTLQTGKNLHLHAASGLVRVSKASETFEATNNDPYFRPCKFPTPLRCDRVEAIAITLTKAKPMNGDALELFVILDNHKGVTRDQHLVIPLMVGTHTYLFDLRKLAWFQGHLTGVRIDPGTRPGCITVQRVSVLSSWPSDLDHYVTAPRPDHYQSHFTAGSDGWPLPSHNDSDNAYLIYHRDVAKYSAYAARTPWIKVSPGAVLTLSAQVKIPEPLEQDRVFAQAIVFDRRHNVVGSEITQGIDHTRDWETIYKTFKVPKDADKVQLRLVNRGRGTAWIRSVQLSPATSSERLRIPTYAGTLEEKKILQSWALRVSGKPVPIQTVIYKDLPQGVRYALNLYWENSIYTEGDFTFRGWAEHPMHTSAHSPVQTVSFYLRCPIASNNLQLNVNMNERATGRPANTWRAKPIQLSDYKSDWRQVTLQRADFTSHLGLFGGPADWARVDLPTFTITGGKGKVQLQIADVTVSLADGRREHMFTVWRDPYWYYPKLEKTNARPAPSAQFRVMQGSGAQNVLTKQGRDFITQFQKLVPNFGIQSNLQLDVLLAHRDWFLDHHIAIGFQNITPGLWQAAVDENALTYPLGSYRDLNSSYHKIDTTSPGWRRIYTKVAKRFEKYGIPEYQAIDCQFHGAPNKVAPEFIRALKGLDGGVQMSGIFGDLGDHGHIHFWDYFQAYTGVRWEPADLKWASWDDYEPTTSSALSRTDLDKKRLYLQMALRHYEYLRYHADLGKIFQTHGGVTYYVMNNGDNWENGNDWVFDASCATIPGFIEETYFYHPRTVIKAYPLGPTFDAVYHQSHTKHRLIAETGKGGHGPIYWAPEISYAIIYAIASSHQYDSMEVDWPVEMPAWKVATNPDNQYLYNRFCDYLAKARAYDDATLNQSPERARDVSRVVALVGTNTMYHGHNANVLASGLEKLNYPVTWGSRFLWNTDLCQDADLVIDDLYALPKGFAAKLRQWADADGRRALVLYGAAAGRRIDGTLWGSTGEFNQIRMNAADQFSSLFGTLKHETYGTINRYDPERPGRLLLKDEHGPLLSVYQRPNGARVYFVHFRPHVNETLDSQVIKAIMAREHVQRMIDTTSESLVFNRFNHPDGTVSMVLFDRDAIDAFHFSARAQSNSLYPWRKKTSQAAGEVRVKPGRYVLYAFLSGKEKAVDIQQGQRLHLTLDGVTAEVFHLVPVSRHGRLTRIKKERALLFHWLDQRVDPENLTKTQ